MTAVSASCSSCDEPSLGPLADHLPLELCQSPEDVEDQFSTAGGGVDLLGQALETDAPLLQPSDRLYKVWERSPETIELPDHERVTRADVAECLFQAITLSGGAAGGIGEDAIATGLCERILLECEGLIMGGDACIAKKHAPIVSQLVTLHKHETMNIGRDCETLLYSGRR
jgi:hypothetical protein